MQRVEKSYWKNKPLPLLKNTINIDRTFSKNEMNYLTLGFLPEEMEDKWFIYWEENKLYFHRSWTGTCIYIVTFKQDGDLFKMYQIDINQDPNEFKETDEQKNIKSINNLIDSFLLRRSIEFPHDKTVLENWSFYDRSIMNTEKN